jgi:hypothetical protein
MMTRTIVLVRVDPVTRGRRDGQRTRDPVRGAHSLARIDGESALPSPGMRFVVAIAVLSACSSSSGKQPITLVDGPSDPMTCIADRDGALDRTCGSAADCTVVASEDCCGEIDIAVHTGTEGGFPAVETAFDRCLACPPVGCAHQTEAEDGTPATSGHTIVAACVASRCTTAVQ